VQHLVLVGVLDRLGRLPHQPGRVARLKRAARFTVVGKKEVVEIENVLNAKNVEQKLGGFAFVLKDVNKIVDDRYAYTYELTPGDHSVEEFNAFRQALGRNMPKLLDAKGQALRTTGGSSSSSPGKFTETYQFTTEAGNAGLKVGPPAKFVWEVPVEIKVLSFPVEFMDMPLP
jgi:hypothetical protein